MPKYSIVVPFHMRKNVTAMYDRLKAVNGASGGHFELVLVE